MPKLIFVDLDGTLLKEHYMVSEANKKAVEYAKKKGVYIGICTGRNALSAMLFSNMAGMNAPVICCGGSVILQGDSSVYRNMDDVYRAVKRARCIYNSVLDRQAVLHANAVAKETGVSYHGCTKDGYYLVGENQRGGIMESWNVKARHMINVMVEYTNDYEGFAHKYGCDISKISFSSLDKDEMKAVFNMWQGFKGVKLTPALSSILEITCEDVDKGSAVLQVCSHMGIDLKDTACIGDDTNDISMFKVCARGIAMGQGVDEIKLMSEAVVSACDEDGFAEAVYTLVD